MIGRSAVECEPYEKVCDMAQYRTFLAVMLSLAMAFVPVAGFAMATSCSMTVGMTADGGVDCPCHESMPNCDMMPQCASGSGCASQCFNSSVVLPSLIGQMPPVQDKAQMGAVAHGLSMSIEPPSPPPRS